MTIESWINHNRSQKNITYKRKINVTYANKPDQGQTILCQSAEGCAKLTFFLSMLCRKILILFYRMKGISAEVMTALNKQNISHVRLMQKVESSTTARLLKRLIFSNSSKSVRSHLFPILKSYNVHKSTINFNVGYSHASVKVLNF